MGVGRVQSAGKRCSAGWNLGRLVADADYMVFTVGGGLPVVHLKVCLEGDERAGQELWAAEPPKATASA
jgi:hypothetical protein